jgi:hypothetical protein
MAMLRGKPILNPISAAWNTVARRYDLVAREGTVDQARAMLRDAGQLPETGNPM